MSIFKVHLLMVLLVAVRFDRSHTIEIRNDAIKGRVVDKEVKNLGFNEATTAKGENEDKKTREDKEETANDEENDEDDEDDDEEEDENDASTGAEKSRREEKPNKGPKIWDQWGKWSPCSVTCGIGKIIRWRHCVGGGCAPGEKEAQIKTCTLPAC